MKPKPYQVVTKIYKHNIPMLAEQARAAKLSRVDYVEQLLQQAQFTDFTRLVKENTELKEEVDTLKEALSHIKSHVALIEDGIIFGGEE